MGVPEQFRRWVDHRADEWNGYLQWKRVRHLNYSSSRLRVYPRIHGQHNYLYCLLEVNVVLVDDKGVRKNVHCECCEHLRAAVVDEPL